MSDVKWQHAVTFEAQNILGKLKDDQVDFEKLKPENLDPPPGWFVPDSKWARWHVASYDFSEMGSITVVWKRLIKLKE